MSLKKRGQVPRSIRVKHFLQKLWGVVAILTMTVLLLTDKNRDPLIVGAGCILGYILALYITTFAFRIFAFRVSSPVDENEEPVLHSVTLDFISGLYMPVMISDVSGRIIWYNKALSEIFSTGEIIYGRYIDQFCTTSIDEIMEAKEAEGAAVGLLPSYRPHFRNDSLNEEAQMIPKYYSVKGYRISENGKEYCVTVWNDRHEAVELRKRLEQSDTVIAYILIDNLDELLQNVEEQYRLASAKVEGILSAWVSGMNGILKEYDRNKFLAVFEAQYLPSLIENRFSVLDEVREVRVGESNMPVTISMGLSHVKSDDFITISAKENSARDALDLALQRGGDQVVFKTENGTEFFGGKTKSAQKSTRIRSRVIAGELASLISGASNVLIMGHKNADHDSIGSCIGLSRFVKFCGVPVSIVLNFNDANTSVCLEKLRSDPEYDGTFVNGAEALDFITSETLLIICDVSNPAQFEAPELYENVKNSVVVDHHRKTGEFIYKPIINYIDPSASSASELVSEILESVLPVGTLPSDEANLLLAGILLDTKQFTSNTGVRTFSAALYLRREGASPADAKVFFRMSLDDYVRESKFGSNVTIYRDVIAIAMKDGSDSTANDRIAASKAADSLLSVRGVMASFALVRIGDSVHISARSQGNVNVQLILERLHGGGHFDSAGAQIQNTPMQTVLEQLKDAIDTYFSENGM